MVDNSPDLWAWTVGLGLPLLAITGWRYWKGSRSLWAWRLAFCFVLAAILTPWGVITNAGHGDGVGAIVFPVIVAFPFGLVPVSLVAGVLFGIWSSLLMFRRWLVSRPSQPRIQEVLRRCVRCDAPLAASPHTCEKCGWAQP